MRQAAGIGAVLQGWLSQRGMAERIREYRAWQVWNETVGPQIAARAQPCRIRDGILEVRVDQPVWMQQLQLLKPQLLTRLNERLGAPLFHDIFLRRGRPEPAAPVKPAPSARPARPLSDAEQAQIERTLAPLTDPDLRRQLRRILVRQALLNPAAAPD
jgi:hypothetical protein